MTELRILSQQGDPELARVFVASLADGAHVEMVESVQPPVPRSQKWVLIVSTLRGCPYGCAMCDAGDHYRGPLAASEILAQIDHLIVERFPDRSVPIPKLKVQFARMGEPALNDAVLAVLRRLPARYRAPGLMPCISTVAPRGRRAFFEELLHIKEELYPGRFQLQFSVHTTDDDARRRLIPARTWGLADMAAYGARFVGPGDRKVTLGFAPARGMPLEPERLAALFSADAFVVKLTPINPTASAERAELVGMVDPHDPVACEELADRFRRVGFETLVSIGELRENQIGSNCGMFVGRARLS